MTLVHRLTIAAGLTAIAVAGVSARQPVELNGAGATFPARLYAAWTAEYGKVRPTIEINYQPVGSGSGIRQLAMGAVFFAGTDQPMTDEQTRKAPGRILHLPTVLSAVVPIYNVPGVTGELRFTGTVLADIFLGVLTRWDDPAIVALNPGVRLPNLRITVVHRSDASGTTYIWADYLAKVSSAWRTQVGVAAMVKWPVGIGGRSTEGVAALVRESSGAIGYIELTHALEQGMRYGTVQNAAGAFVRASAESVTAAAAGSRIPADFRVSITNAAGQGSYPISSFSWILIYELPADRARWKAMCDFLKWALTDGQRLCRKFGFAPLPSGIVKAELALLEGFETP